MRKSQASREGQEAETHRLTESELPRQTHGVMKASEIEPKPPAPGNAGFEWMVEEARPLEGIEREMRVVRCGPNPRMVVAEYWELAERRVVTVNVRDNRKWLKGMRFKMREPLDEEEYKRPWEYKGKAPRRRGRW